MIMSDTTKPYPTETGRGSHKMVVDWPYQELDWANNEMLNRELWLMPV